MNTIEEKQAVLNKVVAAILLQGAPSITERGACRYKFGELKCAIGHLLPDTLTAYDFQLIEGMGARSLMLNNRAKSISNIIKETHGISDASFLEHLQACHDRAASVMGKPISGEVFIPRFKDHIATFVEHHKLKTPKALNGSVAQQVEPREGSERVVGSIPT